MFFCRQSQYLQPAINSVWKHSHAGFAVEVTERESKSVIVLAGDGRSDSPGHSAKYGSYSILELTCNKIVDFKLVQV